MTVAFLLLLLFFYRRHLRCEAKMYSYFSIVEYSLVLMNMVYNLASVDHFDLSGEGMPRRWKEVFGEVKEIKVL